MQLGGQVGCNFAGDDIAAHFLDDRAPLAAIIDAA